MMTLGGIYNARGKKQYRVEPKSIPPALTTSDLSAEGAHPMTDIVERLRKYLKANASVSGNVELWSPVKDDDIREAADEIEHLRAELANLRKFGPVNQAVAAERAAILDLIETFEYRPSRSTTGAVLDDIVSAIKARDRHR
jgi:hypothetical protein